MVVRTDPEMQPLSDLFVTAANMLIDRAADDGPARHLLAQLDYLDGAVEEVPHRAALLRAAAEFARIFVLEAADAPGMVALGAEVDPASVGATEAPLGSVSGTGLTFREAFESCVGEGVEYLSQFATRGDTRATLTEEAALVDATPELRLLWQRLHPYRRDPGAATTAWVEAANLADGTPVRLPADICLRRPAKEREIDPPWPLSIGCGAGRSLLAATLHGLLELIERDALSLWWRGGKRARLVWEDVVATVLARLRGETSDRRTWLLDITTDIGVPVVVAASCNDDGFGLCLGHAAGPTLEHAGQAALMELAQMELAYRVTTAKRAERGEGALNAVDREHERRFTAVSVADTPALHPVPPPSPPRDLPTDDGLSTLAALRNKLASVGLAAAALDLTREQFGIPVVRVVCPGLEAGMIAPPGPRLLAMANRHGVDPACVPPL